jgi:formamidopyrimidine-DNA glycosylase
MPELPDVALFKRHLEATALRREIASLQVKDSRILVGLSAQALARRLKGACFTGTRRHGKHLLVQVDKGGWLTLHFGMSGGLEFFEEMTDEPPYDRVRFDFEGDGHLAYTSRRMLGRVGFAEDAEQFIAHEKLGPDALDRAFDLPAFRKALSKGRRGIKSALMDQSTMAGVGNIYSDEILFQAGLRPDTRVGDLEEEGLARLFATMRGVLTRAVELGAGSEQFLERLPTDYLLPHRHKDGRCPRCGAALRMLKASGRTAYYCARCQNGSAARS